MYHVKIFKKTIICTLCMICLLCSACTTGKGCLSASDTLKICLGPEPDKLDPQDANSAYSASLAFITHSGLLMYGENEKITYACAEKCEVSPDGTVYRFTLKDNLKWSDGSTLTAYDFYRSWQQAGGSGSTCTNKYMFNCIDGYDEGRLNIEVSDGGKVFEVTLKSPCTYFTELCTLPAFFPVKNDNYSEAGFISNGPFVASKWQHNRSIIFTKNENWFDSENVEMNTIEVMLSDSPAAIYAAYKCGDIHFSDTIPPDETDVLKDSGELYVCDMTGVYYISFNINSEFFSKFSCEDAAVFRRAIGLLVNREKIVETVCMAGQKPAYTFLPLSMIDKKSQYDERLGKYDEDVCTAIEMLKSIGYKFTSKNKLSSQTPIELDYITNESGVLAGVSQSVQADLAGIGIKLNILQQDNLTFLVNKRKGNYVMAKSGWLADFNDAVNLLEIHSSDSPNNRCGFGKIECDHAPVWHAYDALIGAIKTQKDVQIRNDYISQALSILMDTGAVCPIYYYSDLYLVSDKVSGIYASCYGHKYFMYASFSE